MDNEELRQFIISVLQEKNMVSFTCPFHQHTITDVGQLDASKSLINSPQSTIVAVAGTPSSGGAGTLSNADSAIIASLITAVNSLITANKNIGLIKS